MENEKKDTLERIGRPDTMPIYSSDGYNDEDIPRVDLPQDESKNSTQNNSQDVIPDEVPRKDGPGGEDSSEEN